ncbi:penicillin-binding protein 2 [Saccharophagus sp. K07]|uniref:penicillin-binding protein 2 n=1 Tax=Saccharophagus sp. K07 TaxID=2283636 RepID=UPI0016527AFF|nr:penicillin-binding protein 2 [Saccharophagus sp. K07]MBC6904450.1 penicillin-binding protein 2 [Saccharophagus sp. K07]
MPFRDIDNDLHRLKDIKTEARLIGSRISVAFVGVLLLFGILIFRFYHLQIVNYEAYVTRAESNRIQVQPVPPNRGLIFDRNGVLLAENRPSYTLSIVKERTPDLEKTLVAVATLIDVGEDDLANFRKALSQRRRPYESVPLRYHLTEEEIARIAVNEYALEGVEVEAQLVRYYPYGELFAHTIGYVGRISERELANFDDQMYRRYSGTHSIGKIGVEKYYEEELLGEVGSQHVEVNAHGRVLRTLERIDPVPGKDIYLNLDIEVQKAAAEAMAGRRGAVVAIEVATGGLLALVSTPSFDPNLFVTGISVQNYRELNESPDLPLLNRTIQGQYPPGSTLKPMLGLGGLESRVITPQWRIRDPGFYILENSERRYRDWKKYGHGNQVDLHQAIVESCDTYFYDLSVRMGVDRMHPLGAAFGLGSRTGIDIPSERAGNWPSRMWKKAVRGLPWFPGDSLNMSIGQGDVLATPLQLAVMTAGLATRGIIHEPRVVERVGNEKVLAPAEVRYEAREENWDSVAQAMEAVVHSARGTAKVINRGVTYRIAGKTGTAQVIGIAQDQEYDRDKIHERNRDHALFIAYAPVEKPEVAVAIVIENGEHGSSAAAPVARQVFDTWFAVEAVRQAQREQEAALGYRP